MATLTEGAVGSLRNASLALLPSPADLLFAVPRFARKASSFALLYLPEQLDGLFSIARNSGTVIADATKTSLSRNMTLMTSTPAMLRPPVASQTSIPDAAEAGSTVLSSIYESFSLDGLRNFDSVFSYLASRWAIATFFVVR